MSVPYGVPPRQPDSSIRDAAYNLLAVASLQYVQAVSALRHLLQCAHGKGLTVAECCDATGLDEPFVSRLLDEVA
jgi:hypothetical protein